MANPNFGALLDKPSSDIERPKPLPTGTYQWAINGLPRFDQSSKKKTDFVEFTCNCIGAGEDVDEEALKEMGGFAGKSQRLTFYITEDALWRLKAFLTEDLGIEEGDKSLRQMIDETPGQQFQGSIVHKASDDGTAVFANIGKTAPVA